jgi:hypothetical protein
MADSIILCTIFTFYVFSGFLLVLFSPVKYYHKDTDRTADGDIQLEEFVLRLQEETNNNHQQ